MTHTKYHCPLIKPCTNCGVKDIRQRAVKALSQHSGSKRPETKPNFQFYHLRWLTKLRVMILKEREV